jgi:hypothetical protein
MIREIKFEYGFNSVNGIIKKKYYLHKIPFMHDECDVWNMLPLIYVRQFTGLTDKNSVDIYEGDIIEWEDGIVDKIIFSFGAFGYENECKEFVTLFDSNLNILEVIGNIYETPQLLNK